MPLASFDLGDCSLRVLNGGRFRLDGGAMFGIIPKPLWTRSCPADADNHIRLACNCLLVEWPGRDRRVIIETGHGAKYAEKERGFFAIDTACWLLPNLIADGVDPDSITDVVLSHLHFDHAGGLTHIGEDGVLHATFPRARVHAHRREFDDARANFGIMHNTYREENYTPIDTFDAWRLIDNDGEILPGIESIATPGHTRGHRSLLVRGRSRTAIFTGDVMPTRHHVGKPYNMAYDLFPLENRASKSRILERAAAENWLICLDHDPDEPVVVAERSRDWYALRSAMCESRSD